jgi:hypothetical protein
VTKSTLPVWQRRRLGRFGDATEGGEIRQQPLSRQPHAAIGLDSENLVPIFKQYAAPDSRTAGDVGSDVFWLQPTLCLQRINDFRRIARAVANIILQTVGEAAGGVGSRHKTQSGKIFQLARKPF